MPFCNKKISRNRIRINKKNTIQKSLCSIFKNKANLRYFSLLYVIL